MSECKSPDKCGVCHHCQCRLVDCRCPTDKLDKAAMSMGYRKVENRWLKPIGKSILIICKLNDQIIVKSCFIDNLGSVSTWSSRVLNSEEDYLSEIQEFECFTRYDICTHQSGFSFLTLEDATNLGVY